MSSATPRPRLASDGTWMREGAAPDPATRTGGAAPMSADKVRHFLADPGTASPHPALLGMDGSLRPRS